MKKKLIFILIFIPVFLASCSDIKQNKVTKIDITGNWQDEIGFLSNIQTREPALKKGELKTFSQELTLPKGKYSLVFEYDQIYEGVFKNNIVDFKDFKINGEIKNLVFPTDSTDKSIYKVYLAEYKFVIREAEKNIKLELSLINTRVMRT